MVEPSTRRLPKDAGQKGKHDKSQKLARMAYMQGFIAAAKGSFGEVSGAWGCLLPFRTSPFGLPKIRVPYFGVLIIRILLFRVL